MWPSAARRYMGQRVTSTPPSMTLPALGSIMPQVMRKLVVFPAPLGPKQADDLAALDLEINAVDDAAAAVGFDQSLDFEHGHGRTSVIGVGGVICAVRGGYRTSSIRSKLGKNGKGIVALPMVTLSQEWGQ